MYNKKILMLCLIFIGFMVIVKYFYIPSSVEKIYSDHICYTNISSTYSYFDTANLTTVLNITHKGYCQSA